MTDGGIPRLQWRNLPETVRAAVAQLLGAQVLAARSRTGGFSPGSADLLDLDDGRVVFVKSAGVELNQVSVQLHRREARISAALPAGLPTPELLGVVDEGGWVALAFAAVDGAMPAFPWREPDVIEVGRALELVAEVDFDNSGLRLPFAADALAEDFGSWARIADRLPPDLPLGHLRVDRLDRLAQAGAEAIRGRHLVHCDIRADNVLLRPTGAVIVDWPWACVGANWIDSVLLLINVALGGGPGVAAIASSLPLVAAAPEADVDAFLAGMAGFFLARSLDPPPPGLPTLRRFQRAQADAVLGLLAARLSG